MVQQRGAVLGNVMVARAFPEIIRVAVVVVEGNRRCPGEFVLGESILMGHVSLRSIMATGRATFNHEVSSYRGSPESKANGRRTVQSCRRPVNYVGVLPSGRLNS